MYQFKRTGKVEDQLANILAATARLEEQATGVRRDVATLTATTTSALAGHEGRVSSLERSRANAKGWVKGLSVVSVIAAMAGYFGWGG